MEVCNSVIGVVRCRNVIDPDTGTCGHHLVSYENWGRLVRAIFGLPTAHAKFLMVDHWIKSYNECPSRMALQNLREDLDEYAEQYPSLSVLTTVPLFIGLDKALTYLGYPHEEKEYYKFVADQLGQQHCIAIQQSRVGCGIACLAMVIYRKYNQQFDEKTLVTYSAQFDHDSSGRGPEKVKPFDDAVGLSGQNLRLMLRKMCIPSSRGVFTLKEFVAAAKGASIKNPLIAIMKYGSGLSHAVVIDGVIDKKIVVCNPDRDVGLDYHPISAGFNYRNIGVFSGFVINTGSE